jgi:serine/threonine protein phosphatase PrpC
VTRVVNNQIVAINDQQQRQAQQRMGTTLVMAVMPRPHGKPSNEVYIVHVGDSRVYCVTEKNLRQVTLDDDVATRETTLGYNFYAYSSQRIDGGALIQALGTRGSDMLVPRVQRFFIDEDCLLLLCSDGLSDFDRVDQIYQSSLLPILTENKPLDRSCQNLIDKANELNGHDNITVALMRCRFAIADDDLTSADDSTVIDGLPLESEPTGDLNAENGADSLIVSSSDRDISEDAEDDTSDMDSAKTEVAVTKQTNSGFIVALVLLALVLGSGLAAMQFQPVRAWVEKNVPINLNLKK